MCFISLNSLPPPLLVDNWAMLFAQRLSLKEKTSLHICYCLVSPYLEATERHYDFIIRGLQEIEKVCLWLDLSATYYHQTLCDISSHGRIKFRFRISYQTIYPVEVLVPCFKKIPKLLRFVNYFGRLGFSKLARPNRNGEKVVSIVALPLFATSSPVCRILYMQTSRLLAAVIQWLPDLYTHSMRHPILHC